MGGGGGGAGDVLHTAVEVVVVIVTESAQEAVLARLVALGVLPLGPSRGEPAATACGCFTRGWDGGGGVGGVGVLVVPPSAATGCPP